MRTLTGLTSIPSDGAADWMTANWPIPAVTTGSRSTAARVTLGAICSARLGVRGSRRRRLQALVDRKNDAERVGPVGEDHHRSKEPTPIPATKIDEHT